MTPDRVLLYENAQWLINQLLGEADRALREPQVTLDPLRVQAIADFLGGVGGLLTILREDEIGTATPSKGPIRPIRALQRTCPDELGVNTAPPLARASGPSTRTSHLTNWQHALGDRRDVK